MPTAAPPTEVDLAAPAAAEVAPDELLSSVDGPLQATADPLPVGIDDAVSGDPHALVTIVSFTDYQCPFCSRVQPTLNALRQRYSPAELRIVVKHNPLPFHPEAMGAARAAQAVRWLAGDEAFFAYSTRLYQDQPRLSRELLAHEAARQGIARARFAVAVEDRRVVDKVDADMALAAAIGARGTPAFRVNGVEISGAQPLDSFVRVIDLELTATRALAATAVPRQELYARRVAENLTVRAPEPAAAAVEAEDDTVWAVPVGTSPARGPVTALVTIVEFSDFQCPFCKRVEPTLEELDRRYPGELRFVFKHNALPFHPRAMPAAMLAIEASRQRGSRGFWAAADELWASSPALEDNDLEAIAVKLGLNLPAVRRAIATEAHRGVVDDDMQLADDFKARGTPHFFVNGVRLSGAQPVERFATVIDAQLVAARALVAQGVPRARVYDELIKKGKTAPPPETRQVPPASSGSPSRGPRGAPVVLQVFSDFQCPFCARVEPTLATLAKEFPRELRIVWRDLPLPFHTNAKLAAEAAREAFAQRGDAGFWAMHDLLFRHQGDPGGLERPALEGFAQQIGLDLRRFRAALDAHTHLPTVEADAALANQAGINGTPASVINGYFVSGAQDLRAFRRIVRRALDDQKRGVRP